MPSSRSLAHITAVVATLGLSVVVAVVAATKTEGPVAEPTPTPSGSPSPSASGVSLNGDGPYVVYALDGAVVAFDLASSASTPLGSVSGSLPAPAKQPGTGGVIAFPAGDGSVWTVSRAGLARVGSVGLAADQLVLGGALSPNGRRLAVGLAAPSALALFDLAEGAARIVGRSRTGEYPENALLPIGWSLGGSVLYQIPVCECDVRDTGLYAFDAETSRSSVVTGTATLPLYRFAMSPEGQAVAYGDATARRCTEGEEGPCTGPPYVLRRLAAGQPRASVLERRSDARFDEVVWSPDGRTIAVGLVTETGSSGLELLDASTGGPIPDAALGAPRGARPVALLPGDVLVAAVGSEISVSSMVALSRGRSIPIATTTATGSSGPVFLGWLR